MALLAGVNTRRYPAIVDLSSYSLGPVQVSSMQVIILLVSAFLMIGLHMLVRRTRIGKAMRAVRRISKRLL